MTSVTIYHNPRCKKSREGLAFLEARNLNPDIINYIKNPLNIDNIKAIAEKLGFLETPREMMRKKEPLYKELNLKDETLSSDALFNAMATHPKLIERPIIITEKGACIARPAEKITMII